MGNTMNNMEQEYYAPEDIAVLLSVSIHTIRSWRKHGDLPPALKIGRIVRWVKQDIHNWINKKKEQQATKNRIAVELGQAPSARERRTTWKG